MELEAACAGGAAAAAGGAAVSSAAAASHRRTSLDTEPEASVAPSGEKATAVILAWRDRVEEAEVKGKEMGT